MHYLNSAYNSVVKSTNKIFYSRPVTWTLTARSYLRLYNLFDCALGNVFAMEQLRHGTCLSSYLWIQLMGADPTMGGKGYGEATALKRAGKPNKLWADASKGKFHVLKDTFAGQDFPTLSLAERSRLWSDSALMVRNKLIGYSFTSGYGAWTVEGRPRPVRTSLQIIGGLLACLAPTLRFRYELNDVPNREEFIDSNWVTPKTDLFEIDPHDPGYGYTTTHPLPIHRIGITGSLVHGLNRELPRRIQENRIKFSIGLLQLTTFSLLIGGKFQPTFNFPLTSVSRWFIRWPAKIVRFFLKEAVQISSW